MNVQSRSIAPREGLWQWRFLLLGLFSLLLAACTNSKMADMFNDAGVKGEQLTRQAAEGRKDCSGAGEHVGHRRIRAPDCHTGAAARLGDGHARTGASRLNPRARVA